MNSDKLPSGVIVAALLRHFPPAIRSSVLADKAFCDLMNLSVNHRIMFDQGQVAFDRSQLFTAVRDFMKGSITSAVLIDAAGREWKTIFDSKDASIRIVSDGQTFVLPSLCCLSTDSARRLEWFDSETRTFRVSGSRIDEWREIIKARQIGDEEVEALLAEFRLTPSYFATAVARDLQRQSIDAKSLVPSDLRYYDRLVGEYSDAMGLKDFFNTVLAPHVSRMVRKDPIAGLKEAFLLSAHPLAAQAIPLGELPREPILEVFSWLETNGDRISQVGAIECGLAHVEVFPELEPFIAKLILAVLSDSPNDKEGRLNLFFSLFVFVEGELARTGTCRQRPPYWRRLASIAHASVLERAVVAAGMPSDFATWAVESRGSFFYLQTFADMRREPRWNPLFALPDQLRAEFIGRIAGAAALGVGKAKTPELCELLDGDEKSIQSKVSFPFSLLPGPLEGGEESAIEMPAEYEFSLRASLDERELSPKSFAALVNAALLYRVNSSLAQLAAEGLRRVKYQLHEIGTPDAAVTLLSGLATVASVTRNADLAGEVRILMRVVRRKFGQHLVQESAMRIALVSAAAHSDITKWCAYVGDCITEFAFGDLSLEDASLLQRDMYILRELEPRLWSATSRADAATSAFLATSV